MDLITPAVSLIAAIIGALIGGRMSQVASLEATKEAHENNRKLQKEAHDRKVNSLEQAIYAEIKVIWDIYCDKIVPVVEKVAADEPLLAIAPLTQDYFTIYNGNDSVIGAIEDPELRKSIVITYIKAKNLTDTFLMNNELFRKF